MFLFQTCRASTTLINQELKMSLFLIKRELAKASQLLTSILTDFFLNTQYSEGNFISSIQRIN